jgi:gliding motility-associated lipoprotein GldH
MPFLYISKNFNLQIMKKTVILLLVLFVTLSCDKKQVYRNFENEIAAQRWNESDVKTHTFEILEDDKSYNVFIEVSHVLGTEMNEFPVNFEVTKPDGSIEKGEVVVNFKNSECMGDVCDVKFLVKEKLKLKKGKYTVKFSPKSKFGFVPNIIGVGLSVEIKE